MVNLREQGKSQNLGRDYGAAIRRPHGLGVMINANFVFGMDDDDPSVFDRTVDWAGENGIETATFHILTPYPGTMLYKRMAADGRLLHSDWDRYDTRHVVFARRGYGGSVGVGLLEGLRTLQFVEGDRSRGLEEIQSDGRTPAFCLCGRMEEVRAVVGRGDPHTEGDAFTPRA